MFHDIVIPLDGSKLAESAIGTGGWIATECRARIHLVRAHIPQEGGFDADDAVARVGVARYLHEMAIWLTEGGVREVSVAVLEGSPALAIADYADRVDADLIVMTTHGRTGGERRRLGSVASVVAHHVSCPVILARCERGEHLPRRTPLERVVLAVDGTERLEEVHTLALRIGSLGHPSFRIVYTGAPDLVPELVHAGAAEEGELCDERQAMASAESYVCGIASRLRAAGLRAEVLVVSTNEPMGAVLEAAERDDAGVLVLLGQWH